MPIFTGNDGIDRFSAIRKRVMGAFGVPEHSLVHQTRHRSADVHPAKVLRRLQQSDLDDGVSLWILPVQVPSAVLFVCSALLRSAAIGAEERGSRQAALRNRIRSRRTRSVGRWDCARRARPYFWSITGSHSRQQSSGPDEHQANRWSQETSDGSVPAGGDVAAQPRWTLSQGSELVGAEHQCDQWWDDSAA